MRKKSLLVFLIFTLIFSNFSFLTPLANEENQLDQDANWVETGNNLLEDGSFTSTSSFGTADDPSLWNVHNQGVHEDWAGLATFNVTDETVTATIEQGGWEWWHIQLFQDIQDVPAGTYKFAVDLSSEEERSITGELLDSGTGLMSFHVGPEMETHEYIIEVDSTGDFKFLIGLGRDEDAPELTTPYDITIDNARLVEVMLAEDKNDANDDENETDEKETNEESEGSEETEEPEESQDQEEHSESSTDNGNLLSNGDFSNGDSHWEVIDVEGGDTSLSVINEEAVLDIQAIGGMHHEWNVPVLWSNMLVQEGIQLEGNSIYEFSFSARSSMDRPIVLELTNFQGNYSKYFHLTEEMQDFSFEVTARMDAELDFRFLVGYVVDGDFETENTPHTITIDHTAVVRTGDAEVRDTEPDWELVWSDEFEGSELDMEKWNYDTGNGFYDGDEWVPGWGNEELQYYKEDNVRVENGHLILEGRQLDEPISDEHGSYDYSSGKITTENKFSQAYGRFEASMKLPEGNGYWPAFWMMPQDDAYGGWAASGEIDIMENAGHKTDVIGGAIHYGGVFPNNTHSTQDYTFTEGSTTDFNEYAVEWEPGEIRWYVNDELYYIADEWYTAGHPFPAPFDQEFYLILNLAIGGWYGKLPDETTPFPGEVAVDYVRVYEDLNADHPEPVIPEPKEEEATEEDEETTDEDRLNQDANWVETGENLLKDGTFETTGSFGTTDEPTTWNVHNQGLFEEWAGLADFTVEDERVRATVKQVGWEWWHIQFFQFVDDVSAGIYKFAVDLSSEEERTITGELAGSGSGLMHFHAGPEVKTHEYIIEVDNAGDFRFLLGLGRDESAPVLNTPYDITIDNARLVEVTLDDEATEEEEDTETEEQEQDQGQDKNISETEKRINEKRDSAASVDDDTFNAIISESSPLLTDAFVIDLDEFADENAVSFLFSSLQLAQIINTFGENANIDLSFKGHTISMAVKDLLTVTDSTLLIVESHQSYDDIPFDNGTYLSDVLSIELYGEDNVHIDSLSEGATITLTLFEDATDSERLNAVHYKGNDDLSLLDGTLSSNGEAFRFETESFSQFTVVELDETDETGTEGENGTEDDETSADESTSEDHGTSTDESTSDATTVEEDEEHAGDGDRLPDTASNQYLYLLSGIMFLLVAMFLFIASTRSKRNTTSS